MWNGKPITADIDLRLLSLNLIQESSYYRSVKPNYDKHIDEMIKADIFQEMIKSFIDNSLNYPFDLIFDSLKQRSDFIYSQDTDWHANFLYYTFQSVYKETLAEDLFKTIYKKHKNYYVRDYRFNETYNEIQVIFSLQDKTLNDYEVCYSFKKSVEKMSFSFNSCEINFDKPKYKMIKKEIIVKNQTDEKLIKKSLKKIQESLNFS